MHNLQLLKAEIETNQVSSLVHYAFFHVLLIAMGVFPRRLRGEFPLFLEKVASSILCFHMFIMLSIIKKILNFSQMAGIECLDLDKGR